MEVFITYMTCMLAVALALGVRGPIRRQATQPEKTVPIGGKVTLMCPFVPDATWVWVYWKKNEETIYSLPYQNDNPWVNDTRYEGSNHATRLTIKDLQKTDSGIYHCKVATSGTTDFIKEGGHVLLSVTDQEIEYSTTSPCVPCSASTAIPPQPAITTVFIVLQLFFLIILIIVIMRLVHKHRQRVRYLQPKSVSAFRRQASRCRPTSTPLAPDSSDKFSELEQTLMTAILEGRKKSILEESETRRTAPRYISRTISEVSTEISGSASLNQQVASRNNQSANETEQETSRLSQSDEYLAEEDNFIEILPSKVIKVNPAVQKIVSARLGDFHNEADRSGPIVCLLCHEVCEYIRGTCEHLTVCKSCLKKHDFNRKVCRQCSGISDTMSQDLPRSQDQIPAVTPRRHPEANPMNEVHLH